MDGNQHAMAFAAANASSRSTTISSNRDSSCRSPAPSDIISAPRKSLGMTPSTVATRPRKVRGASGRNHLVWPMSRDVRDCNDIVHGDIRIPPAVQVVLDSPYVQRLVNLKQLGCAFNTYPCCTHTRKEHSLGVMGIASQLATNLKQRQHQLGISFKDTLCVGIAGLCHDLGHGPFSHSYEAFLKAAYKNEKYHPEQYKERNEKFKEQFGIEIPPLPEKYEHEDTSLMMIDAMLASRGLEIDWDNLDKPLKQVGDGIDCQKFGFTEGQDKVDPFTSRDWIFIKECVYGAPLDGTNAPEAQKTFIGREREKEFLYDIVNNRHSGHDTDKVDYFDRDAIGAFGNTQGNSSIFLRDAFVAKGECPNHNKCFQCKDKDAPGKHLMICYPKKHVSSAMNFFHRRMKNHETIYTHKKTKAAELQMVDLLVEADKHFCMLLPTQHKDPYGTPVPSRFDDFEYPLLPISRAWMYPRLFLRTDDTIVSLIEAKVLENPTPELHSLRQYLDDRRNHRFYKRVGEIEIRTAQDDKVWKLSEDQILKGLLVKSASHQAEDGGVLRLKSEDIIVEKRTLHYGRKDQNPVSQMRFLARKIDQADLLNSVATLPLAVEVEDLPMNTPKNFIRKTIRIFCRKYEKCELLEHSFQSWKFMTEKPDTMLNTVQEEDNEEDNTESDSQPQLLTQEQDDKVDAPSSTRKRKSSYGTILSEHVNAKKCLF